MKLYLLLPLTLLIACSQEPTSTVKKSLLPQEKGYMQEKPEPVISNTEAMKTEPEETTITSKSYTYDVVYTDSIGWGYEILQDEAVVIKQVYIPAIQGNFAFRTEQDAQKTAEFILEKMNNNIFPPTLSKDELTYLNVLP
jgi:hypothetical protein